MMTKYLAAGAFAVLIIAAGLVVYVVWQDAIALGDGVLTAVEPGRH